MVIKKENYPDQLPAKRQVSGSTQEIYRQPGHTIYLLPTMVLVNQLPCELNYYIKGVHIQGSLNPGKEAVLHLADTSQNLELGQKRLPFMSTVSLKRLWVPSCHFFIYFSSRSLAGELSSVQRAADSSWHSELRGPHEALRHRETPSLSHHPNHPASTRRSEDSHLCTLLANQQDW